MQNARALMDARIVATQTMTCDATSFRVRSSLVVRDEDNGGHPMSMANRVWEHDYARGSL
jgi:hypothetical protein